MANGVDFQAVDNLKFDRYFLNVNAIFLNVNYIFLNLLYIFEKFKVAQIQSYFSCQNSTFTNICQIRTSSWFKVVVEHEKKLKLRPGIKFDTFLLALLSMG